MDNKLQQLTQQLFDEGLERGREEADRLLADAKAKAEKIVADATLQAEDIVKKAKSEAEDAKKNSMTEISMAGKQAIAKIKSEIENVIVTKSTSKELMAVAMDASFIKEMLVAVAKNWSGDSSSKVDLQALLPQAEKSRLDAAIQQSAKELLDAGVEVGYSADVVSGFKVGAKDGGYYISFSDADFDALMRGYLREKLSTLLFKA